MFVEECAHLVLGAMNEGIPVAVCHATSSYMFPGYLPLCLQLVSLDRAVGLVWVLVADFDDARPSGAGTWTALLCYRGLSHVVMSAVSQVSPIRRVKLERQEISVTRGVCETQLLLGSSVLGTGRADMSMEFLPPINP